MPDLPPDKKESKTLYDHMRKAGNRGDVAKHPALMAALGSLLKLDTFDQRRFVFSDMYGGHGYNLLSANGEWTSGIGNLSRKSLALVEDPYLRAYMEWYLPRPNGSLRTYPGSSVIACDMALALGRAIQVKAWDISLVAYGHLKRVLGDPHIVRNTEATEEEIRRSDLLFIDPPSRKDWPGLYKMVTGAKNRQLNLLMWLPFHGGKKDGKYADESKRVDTQRDEAKGSGLTVTTITWESRDKRIQLIGCDLLYRFSDCRVTSAVQATIDATAALCGWRPPQHSALRESHNGD